MLVGLDIDGVLADFPAAVIARAEDMLLAEWFPIDSDHVDHWNMSEKFAEVMKDAWEDPEFWLSLPVIRKSLPPWSFAPDCYITSRPIDSEVTVRWLEAHGFIPAPVFTVSNPDDKVPLAHLRHLDLFIDDYYRTVYAMRENGINAVLFKAPYQRGHRIECGDLPMIDSLQEINESSDFRQQFYLPPSEGGSDGAVCGTQAAGQGAG